MWNQYIDFGVDKMSIKKITALIAAFCLTLVPLINSENILSVNYAAAAENETKAEAITFNCVGDKTPITISGTTEIPTWYSDNEAIAKVEVTGDMTADIIAVGKGQTSVYAVLSEQVIRFDVVVLKQSADETIIKEVGTFTLTNEQPSVIADLGGIDSSDVEWNSSDTSVAVVDKTGTITATGMGSCTINAVYGDYTYVINIISNYNPQQTTEPIEKYIGEMTLSDEAPTKKINAELSAGMTVKYSSSDESVAIVSADGIVTAKGSGNCRIFADVGNVRNYINVISTYTGKEQNNVIAAGKITLTADVPSQKMTLSNIHGDSPIIWSSSDKSTAVVNSSGVIIAMGKGSCKVSALVDETEYVIDVIVDITDNSQLPVTEIRGIGKTIALEVLSDDVKFISTDEEVVTVDENGVITAKSEGYALVAAEYTDSISFLRVRVTKAGLMGDANCDGKITLADAASIFQALGNPDKYELSDEGKSNADVDGKKGLTANDAIVIQMFNAKLVSTLPLKI